jgi:hypothetical protein
MASSDPDKKDSMGLGTICLIILCICIIISIVSFAAGGSPFIQLLLLTNCLAMLSQ